MTDGFGLDGTDRPVPVESATVDSGPLFGGGLLVRLGEALRLDLGLEAGTFEASSMGLFPAEVEGFVAAGRSLLRFEPLRDRGLRPWLAAGLRGVVLVPDETRALNGDQPPGLTDPDDHGTVDFAIGAGVDVPLGRRSTLTFGGEHGFGDTGWSAGAALRFHVGMIDPEERPRPGRLDLDVDTDRDGIVEDRDDDAGEATYSPDRGALLLVNLDHDDGRPDSDGHPSDRGVGSRADAADLADLHLRYRSGTFELHRRVALRMAAEAASRARILYGGTEVLGPSSGELRGGFKEHTVPGTELQGEGTLRFWVEAVADPVELGRAGGNFAGSLVLELVSYPQVVLGTGATPAPAVLDTVHLRIAPWLVLGNLDPAEELFAVAPGLRSALLPIVSSISPPVALAPAAGGGIWVQDQAEIGFSEWPASRLHAIAHAGFGSGIHLPALAAAGTGGFERPAWSVDDFFGNVEVTPPLEHRDKRWPLGRIYHGGNVSAPLRDFLAAQRAQAPVEVDVGWLAVGHVDELFSFIPNPAGAAGAFKVLVASPRKAFQLLETLRGQGRGGEPVAECGNTGHTVEGVLTKFPRNLDDWQPRIDAARARFAADLGLRPDDFIEVPVVFLGAVGRAEALVSNPVNLLSLNRHLVIPKPCVRVFEEDLLAELAAVGYRLPPDPAATVHFVDTTGYPGGEIHCLTNVRRSIPEGRPWWTVE